MPKIGNKDVFKSRIRLDVEARIHEADFKMMGGDPRTITIKVERKNSKEPLGPHNQVVTVDATWSDPN
jgi:hypothetical protein